MAIDNHIIDGLIKDKPPHRTMLVALDMRAAFNTVNTNTILEKICQLTQSPMKKRWLCAYLKGRQTYTEFRNAFNYRKVRSGVPQKGVLSPILFNAYMPRLPTPPVQINITYADDCTVYASGPDVLTICCYLKNYLQQLQNWFQENSLELSTGKSSPTLFTTSTKEVAMEMHVTIEGAKVSTKKNPKILGVTFDSMHIFKDHVTRIQQNLREKNKKLPALTGST